MKIVKIRDFVKKKFEDKVDLAGQPYFDHLERVASTVPLPYIITAYLHDILEDTDTTLDELRGLGLDEDTVRSVIVLTKGCEPYKEYIERVKRNYCARVVKMADLKDNMDITRLNRLSARDIERIKKYHKAYIYLKN